MSAKKHIVSLTDEERETLKSYLRSGVHSTRFLNRVRVLLGADNGQGDPEIARNVGVSKVTAYNIRRRFAAKGLQAGNVQNSERAIGRISGCSSRHHPRSNRRSQQVCEGGKYNCTFLGEGLVLESR